MKYKVGDILIDVEENSYSTNCTWEVTYINSSEKKYKIRAFHSKVSIQFTQEFVENTNVFQLQSKLHKALY